MSNKIKKLLNIAKEKALNSYSPYSKFRVGCAILTKSNNIYTGVNVENRSYGATICAERSAISSAISNGEKDFLIIAIIGLDTEEILSPCGICRQVISEFGNDTQIVMANKKMEYKIISIKELLPFDSLQDLKK